MGVDVRGIAALRTTTGWSTTTGWRATTGWSTTSGWSSIRSWGSLGLQRAGDSNGSGGGLPDVGWLAVPAGFLVSSIPFSYLMARRAAGVDLRRVGSGTVSGTGLFEVAGFGPLAAAGICEVAKGAVGPLLGRRSGPAVAAAAGAASVIGHNWSPFLRGAGGRGLSPAIGALLVGAPVGAAVLLAGMAGGRIAGETAVGTVVADAALVPISRSVHGPDGGRFAAAVLAPMVVKRLAGNARPARPGLSPYLWRVLFDRDTRLARPLAGARP